MTKEAKTTELTKAQIEAKELADLQVLIDAEEHEKVIASARSEAEAEDAARSARALEVVDEVRTTALVDEQAKTLAQAAADEAAVIAAEAEANRIAQANAEEVARILAESDKSHVVRSVKGEHRDPFQNLWFRNQAATPTDLTPWVQSQIDAKIFELVG